MDKRRSTEFECQDFDEAVCHFFDLGDPLLDDYKNFGLSDAQYLLLKNFREMNMTFFCDDNDDPRDFINSPEWRKIMSRAQEVLEKRRFLTIRKRICLNTVAHFFHAQKLYLQE